jgi:tetratricopeptide (TPR) repeat protein
MSDEKPGRADWKEEVRRVLSSRRGKWIIVGCIVIIASIISAAVIYNYFAERGLREKRDLELLLDMLEKEIREIEENRSVYGPPPPRMIIKDARMLLDRARQYFRWGMYDLAWMEVRKLMFMLRGYFLYPSINATSEETAVKCILLGKIDRVKRWIDVFTEISERTRDESVRSLLVNTSNTLRKLVEEAEQLVERGSYQEAKAKLDEAFRIIDDTLRSLRSIAPPPPRKDTMRAPPRFSDLLSPLGPNPFSQAF